MNGTTLERPEVAAYLTAVRAELEDLPAEERDELLADVEASLLETGEPPALPPREFAAELRDAAGLAPGGTGARTPSIVDSVREWLTSQRSTHLRSTARELAPIWWLARAYVAVAGVALAVGWGWPVGSGTSETLSIETSWLALILAVVVSLWLGLRGRRTSLPYRRVRLAATAVLAVGLLPVAAHSVDQLAPGTNPEPFVITEQVPGLALDGVQIRNLFPYSRDGRLLQDVLLFDESGRPISLLTGTDDVDRRVLETGSGEPVLNSFPIRYYEPGTKRVARPNLAPPVLLPDVVTPPLEPR